MTVLVRLTLGTTVSVLIVLLVALPTIRPTADQVLAGGVLVLIAMVGFIVGLSWWMTRHYVASAATGWRYTTIEELKRAEARAREEQGRRQAA
jgi:ABC-type uncharacterized transport system permease subunit